MITAEHVRGACETIIEAHPGASNPRTMNWNEDGTPCCIAGHVYELLDVDMERDIEGSAGALAEETPFFVDWDYAAVDLLSRVQSFADIGFHGDPNDPHAGYLIPGDTVVTWREALDRALTDESID